MKDNHHTNCDFFLTETYISEFHNHAQSSCAPVNTVDSMENVGSWTVSGSKELQGFVKTLHTNYSSASMCFLHFSTNIHFFHTIRHMYRSTWSVREAKPCFGATLVHSAHDCNTCLLLCWLDYCTFSTYIICMYTCTFHLKLVRLLGEFSY